MTQLRATGDSPGPLFHPGQRVETIPRPATIKKVIPVDGHYVIDIDPAGGYVWGGMVQTCGERAIRAVEQ